MNHRMLDAIAQDRLSQFLWVFFRVEFGRMDADDDDFFRERLFQLTQGFGHMNAVDAAEGPEIENDQSALEMLQTQWFSDIEPGLALTENFRCPHHAEHVLGPEGSLAIRIEFVVRHGNSSSGHRGRYS